ncbi:MAG: HAD hydrolase family protein [Succinivibrio sp.]|nr:HAD hydrolase family protein [Succinivibrio sp.]
MEIKQDAEKKAQKVKLIIFDVDGVLTDGGIYIGENGELYKPFFCRDGLAITLCRKAGLKTAIITGRNSKQLAYRAKELKIDEVFQGHMDKRAAYRQLKERTGFADEEIAYIADDLIDLPILLQVGFPMAVGDAVPEVKDVSCLVSGFNGGHGAVRELLEYILKSQGLWAGIISDFYHNPSELEGIGQ